MNDDEICVHFEAGLRDFLAADMRLVEFDADERAVGARLARFVAPYFEGFDTDSDYNRRGPDLDPKYLNLPAECRGGGRRRVKPDLIVHHRGDDTTNILVGEIKMETNNEPRDCDLIRVSAFRAQLYYRVGFFLELPAGRGAADRAHAITWFRD
ncbi:hypothetical protein [Mesorhizobium carmichaelinearum]|uniref:hypothetical protein n=1 Tax=Mesorhizobium carmichaelinearum TaxID=1208188 RepID=UPI000BA394D8|nr:hypothetical protein [Mesorhizobium carmichaelinearum]